MTCMTPYHSSTSFPLSNIYSVRWSQTYIQALERLETKCEKKSISSSYQKRRRKKKSTTHTRQTLWEKRRAVMTSASWVPWPVPHSDFWTQKFSIRAPKASAAPSWNEVSQHWGEPCEQLRGTLPSSAAASRHDSESTSEADRNPRPLNKKNK